MVNASLNWASIVGIVLAVCGGGLYFLRSFKPALARDYDVFFAAIGLLCGGILFFQGWRLDPILQFGQFLLAGTTVFFAYESVRLRGVATDQARRSSYFEDEEIPNIPRNPRGRFDDEYDKFDEPERFSRRFKSLDNDYEDEYIERRSRGRNLDRVIPASAASRRRPQTREIDELETQKSRRRSSGQEDRLGSESIRNNFGERCGSSRNEVKRGSRPRANEGVSRKTKNIENDSSQVINKSPRSSVRQQIPKNNVEEASFQNIDETKKNRSARRQTTSGRTTSKNQSGRYTVAANKKKPRDNSSRFDD